MSDYLPDEESTSNSAKQSPGLGDLTWGEWAVILITCVGLWIPAIYWVFWRMDPTTPTWWVTYVPAILGFLFQARGLRLVQMGEGIVTTWTDSSLLGAFLHAGAIRAMTTGEDNVVHLDMCYVGRIRCRFRIKGSVAVVIGLFRVLVGLGLVLLAYALRIFQTV